MSGIDFADNKRMITALTELDTSFQQMFIVEKELEENVRSECEGILYSQACEQLANIPVEELKRSKAGIRTASLEEAGCSTLLDLHRLSGSELLSIPGIGEKQAASIRVITEEFLRKIRQRERIRLSLETNDTGSRRLIPVIARYRKASVVCRDAEGLSEPMHLFLRDTVASVKIRNRFRWIFSLPGTREETQKAVLALRDFMESPQYKRAEHLLGAFDKALQTDEQAAWEDFKQNSAAYYALIEQLTGQQIPSELLYSSIPARLASEIAETRIDLSGLKGNLRAYQKFGVQYILHQKKVLLGDEMGLGKTIQAIAVMAHLYSENPECRFLIICPASVLINWCREIRKFSDLRVHLLHGSFLEDSFKEWKEHGQAAVTNYESMRKLSGRIDHQMHLDLLVIDEAHYIKNPLAQRTLNIRRLDDESDRILMMTGTPLENRVEEMCELIHFIRPELTGTIREYAALTHTTAFREELAPVYLRRQVEEVLNELPPLVEKEEWCRITMEDAISYAKQLQDRNFMGMRRVSFLQEDLKTSSKALRLQELCDLAREEGKKVILYSYFRETIRKLLAFLGDACIGSITGSTSVPERQSILDRFTDAPAGKILVCQIQAGGTGMNIQTASVVIFCEPQIKPSLEKQAISRVYRMGQIQTVLVFRLLCENTIDEAILRILDEKQEVFDQYADESVLADAADSLADRSWVEGVIEEERKKYLPAVLDDPDAHFIKN